MQNDDQSPLKRAKDAVGGAAGLSRAFSEIGVQISSQAISQWERVPANRALDVERFSGVSKHELRPDVFGPPEGVEGTAA